MAALPATTGAKTRCKEIFHKGCSKILRDDNFHPHDYVGIVLDTYHDHQNAYGFWVNPYGIQNDFTTQNDGANNWWGINGA